MATLLTMTIADDNDGEEHDQHSDDDHGALVAQNRVV